MTNLYNWFAGLATIGGFVCFMAGFGFAFAARWIYCRVKREHLNIPWYYIGIVIGCAAILVTAIQSSSAYNTAKQTAQEVQDCQKEFNMVLRTRARISQDNDLWSQTQRKALGDWLRAIIFPPPDIVALQNNAPNDPRIQQWGTDVTGHYSQIIQTAQREQDANLAERARHPLPDPTCGR